MASALDRHDSETASAWLDRLCRLDESALEPSELSQLQTLRQQASAEAAKETGDEIIAQAVARQTGETATEHQTRFQQVDKEAMSIDQLLELSSHKEALKQGAQEEKIEEHNRIAVASPITPPDGTTRPLTLEQVKVAYFHLTSEDRQRFRIWVGSGCPKTERPTS
jgi:hypothetical protein